MQTSVAGNADKRLMEKALSKASSFPSFIATALWPSTYPGHEGHLLDGHGSARGLRVLNRLFIFRGELSVKALLLVMPCMLLTDLGVFAKSH